MVSQFSQPDHDADGAGLYKDKIDPSIAVVARLGDWFAAHESDPQAMTVDLDAGWILAGLTLTEKGRADDGDDHRADDRPAHRPRRYRRYDGYRLGHHGHRGGEPDAAGDHGGQVAGRTSRARRVANANPKRRHHR